MTTEPSKLSPEEEFRDLIIKIQDDSSLNDESKSRKISSEIINNFMSFDFGPLSFEKENQAIDMKKLLSILDVNKLCTQAIVALLIVTADHNDPETYTSIERKNFYEKTLIEFSSRFEKNPERIPGLLQGLE